MCLVNINFVSGSALWCYECVSTEPGCGTPLNWLFHWTRVCPESDDICVKIIEEKNGTCFTLSWELCLYFGDFVGDKLITRSCLSSVQGYRKDIPADHYEGCRPAATYLNLGHYVNNSIKELDIHRYLLDNINWNNAFI